MSWKVENILIDRYYNLQKKLKNYMLNHVLGVISMHNLAENW